MNDYKKSNWIYRLFNYSEKKKIEVIKEAAEKKTESNDKEIKVLEKTETKF